MYHLKQELLLVISRSHSSDVIKMVAKKKNNRLLEELRLLPQIGVSGCLEYGKIILSNILEKKTKKKISNPQVLLISLPKFSTDFPPLGIAYLKSYLNAKQIECRCIDYNILFCNTIKKNTSLFDLADSTFEDNNKFERFFDEVLRGFLDKCVLEINKINPQFLGISVTSYIVSASAKYLAKQLKLLNPKINIIMGGPVFMKDSEEFIVGGFADVVIRGEGEKSFYDVIKAISDKKRLTGISGAVYMKDKVMIDQGMSHCTSNLDLLPFPDFDDFDLKKYGDKPLYKCYPTLPLLTNRGCNGACNFCDTRLFWDGFKSRSASNVFLEIMHQRRKYKTCSFVFHDSAINCSLKFLEELCNLIIKQKILLFWSVNIRFREGMSKKLIYKMRKAGCYKVVIGLESGSEKIRKDMQKPCSDISVAKQLRDLWNCGMQVHLLVMIGYPTETIEEFNKTIRFIIKNKKYITSVDFGRTCHIIPGTKLAILAGKIGIKFDKDQNWYKNKNTLKERIRRLETAKRVGKKCGLVVRDTYSYRTNKLKNQVECSL